MNKSLSRTFVASAAVMLIASTAVPALAQEKQQPIKPDTIRETPDERTARMFRAFDDPASYRAGALIVNFTPGTTKEAARAVLARYNIAFDTETSCGPEEAGPTEERIKPSPGKSICRTFEKWIVSTTAAVVVVPAGEERAYAERLIREPQVVWVEPDLIAYAAGENGIETPQVESPKTGTRQSGTRIVSSILIGVLIALGIALILRKRTRA